MIFSERLRTNLPSLAFFVLFPYSSNIWVELQCVILISIDLSLYAGKILIIKNVDGNRNYFGFYSAITNGTTQQIYSARQSAANGILKICVDNFYPRLSGARYVCYDYTSNNQTQGIPSVEIVDANDL